MTSRKRKKKEKKSTDRGLVAEPGRTTCEW